VTRLKTPSPTLAKPPERCIHRLSGEPIQPLYRHVVRGCSFLDI
jgi:hypothetical protein